MLWNENMNYRACVYSSNKNATFDAVMAVAQNNQVFWLESDAV